MSKAYVLVLITFFFISCSSSRKSIANTQEDKTLIAAIKNLDKNPSDSAIKNTLSRLYTDASEIHLNNIDVYNTLTEESKWEKIINEYLALQHLSEVINSSAIAKNLLKASTYNAEMQVVKENAAADFYNIGENYLTNNDKESSRNAYYAFKKAQEFVPGYKDSKRQMDISYQNSVINVVVNPVSDNSYYYNNTGWNRYGNSFNNDFMQRNLVRDLGGDYTKNASARFYTDWDARNSNVNPDVVIDLTWVNLDVPIPYTSQYSRNVSRQIEAGRDTSGHVYYQTVTATLFITKKYFTATGDFETRITDLDTRNNLDTKRYTAQFNWEQEYATYTGDSRALNGNDLSMLNNYNYQVPRKEDILNELYQRIYPQVKNGIYNSVRW